MRIAVVLTASAGGIGRHVAGTLPRLLDRGHQLQVFCPAETAARFGFAQWVPVRPLWALARAGAADVVHAHGYKAIAAAAVLQPSVRAVGGYPSAVPLVGSWHNAVLATGLPGLAGHGLQRFAARTADLTLAASQDLVELARRLGARRARLGPVAAPGLGLPGRPRDQVRAELGVGERSLVLSVGRLTGQKNYPMLLEVARRWPDDRVRFAVVGDGPDRESLQQRIDQQRLPVRLLGTRPDVADLLAAADAFLLTSHWEARALVVQEAMRAGVPVVATAVGGLPDLVGADGLLVPADDPAAAVQALRAVLEDQALARRLAVGGTARARGWPDEGAVALDLESAYRSVLSTGLRRRAGGRRP